MSQELIDLELYLAKYAPSPEDGISRITGYKYYNSPGCIKNRDKIPDIVSITSFEYYHGYKEDKDIEQINGAEFYHGQLEKDGPPVEGGNKTDGKSAKARAETPVVNFPTQTHTKNMFIPVGPPGARTMKEISFKVEVIDLTIDEDDMAVDADEVIWSGQ